MSVRRYVQIGGVLYERGTEPRAEAPMIMPDIAPYRSMIDGSLISSRSRHREHLREHGMQEVGNDSSLHKPPAPNYDVNPAGRKEMIRAQIDRMTHAEFTRARQRALDNLRWNSRKD